MKLILAYDAHILKAHDSTVYDSKFAWSFCKEKCRSSTISINMKDQEGDVLNDPVKVIQAFPNYVRYIFIGGWIRRFFKEDVVSHNGNRSDDSNQ